MSRLTSRSNARGLFILKTFIHPNKKIAHLITTILVMKYAIICMVEAAGFEPATSCTPSRRANRAALRPDRYHGVLYYSTASA